jgi:hypothetical protein
MQLPGDSLGANIRASHFYLLSATAACPYCEWQTRVFALVVPADHQSLHSDDDAEAADAWQPADAAAVLFHVAALNAAAALKLRGSAPGYRPLLDPPSGAAGWTNHCDRCDEPLEDDELHSEPDAPFMPTSPEGARAIRLTNIREAIETYAADSAIDPQWLPDAARN